MMCHPISEAVLRLRLGLGLVLVLLLTRCGSDGSDRAIAKLTIAPATASVAAGTILILHGDAVGFGNDPLEGWYMQEAKGAPGALYCGLDTSAPAPSWTDCPCGYINYDTQASGVSSEAIYHAPPTPGTCHRVFDVSARNGFVIGLSETTTAEITVTP
jgi:hypothetical protein